MSSIYGNLSDWLRSVPQITRYWFAGSVFFFIIRSFRDLNPYNLTLELTPFIYRFQFWRPLTAVLFYPVSIEFLFNLYFLYSYSTNLETSPVFFAKPADYIFMLIFNWLCLVLVSFAAGLNILMEPMIQSVVYVWCQLNKDVIVSFLFGIRFKAHYLPWIWAAYKIIIHYYESPLVTFIISSCFNMQRSLTRHRF